MLDEAALVSYLVRKYRCHAIIIYGSMVRGDFAPDSDIDVVGFADIRRDRSDVSPFQGRSLDV
ncbi:MAG: nucleotidyltransferase domain-containing protein [Alphaproteobacteria bacterium]|nr:nucleotidyltransferase domain-containing protein [Alphaproteobacteria bacterium]